MGEYEFGSCAFDWYVMERWNRSDPIQASNERRRTHLKLGIAFAAIGHMGRRPYASKAFEWCCGQQSAFPCDISLIPTDLLTPVERKLSAQERTPEAVWIRTSYGPGTDARFQELVEGLTDAFDGHIANDARRYNLSDDKSLFAFFPSLLKPSAVYYEDDFLADDDPELLQALYLTEHETTMSEEHRLTCQQTHYFVADDQAMRTGLIDWRMIDEYGRALFSERISPCSLQQARGLRLYRSPQEFREEIARGWYSGQSETANEKAIGPWEPPADDGVIILAYEE